MLFCLLCDQNIAGIGVEIRSGIDTDIGVGIGIGIQMFIGFELDIGIGIGIGIDFGFGFGFGFGIGFRPTNCWVPETKSWKQSKGSFESHLFFTCSSLG